VKKRVWLLTNIAATATSDHIIAEFTRMGWGAVRVSPQALPIQYSGEGTRLLSSADLPELVYTRLGSLSPFESIAAVRGIESLGIPVVNSSHALSLAKDKVALAQMLSLAGVKIPQTLFLPADVDLSEFVDALPSGPPWVVKLLRGTKGKGVMKVDSYQSLRSVVDTFQALESALIIQEMIPSQRANDIRVLVVGGSVLGAVRRVAEGDEFRSNMHLGGKLERIEITQELENIALTSVKAFGLFVAGVDLMESENGYCVLEVNTSPGLNAFAASGQHNVITAVVERLVEYYESLR
jgi:ribosomal protein S6--L-glutamate ligase